MNKSLTEKRTGKTLLIVTILLLAVLLSACNVNVYLNDETKQEQAKEPEQDTLEQLYKLNRESYGKLNVDEGPIYVIGHKNPDSDTVCSAIVFARMLTLLGYDAEAAITGEVNEETAYILNEAGVKEPAVLENAAEKNIFLLDHSEYAQAAEGMNEAHIVGILDHHGIGGVTTGHQILYEARPMGATATMVWMDYMNCGFVPDKTASILLLGAVLSDTTNLTGSTSTEVDRQAVDSLAGLAGIDDVNGFYRELRTRALSYEGMSNEEILFSDYKEYEISGVGLGIGLVNVIDEDSAREMAARMRNALDETSETKQVDLLYASVGIREDGVKIDYIIPCDEKSEQILKEAFPNFDEYDGTSYIFRKGLGRKTKFVPGLTDYFTSNGVGSVR